MKKFYLGLVAVLILGGISFFLSRSTSIESKVVELHITRGDDNFSVNESSPKRTVKVIPLKASRSICSGAFVSSNGIILTAKHCTENADHIDVLTFDHKTYTAQILRQSTLHDLAVIQIAKKHTPYFRLAPSIQRGEKVFALGSPLGITDTLSTGIIANLIGDQTLIDCAALPGNSGCPLFNTSGELVGIVTAGFWVGFGTTHLNIAQGLDAIKVFLENIR